MVRGMVIRQRRMSDTAMQTISTLRGFLAMRFLKRNKQLNDKFGQLWGNGDGNLIQEIMIERFWKRPQAMRRL